MNKNNWLCRLHMGCNILPSYIVISDEIGIPVKQPVFHGFRKGTPLLFFHDSIGKMYIRWPTSRWKSMERVEGLQAVFFVFESIGSMYGILTYIYHISPLKTTKCIAKYYIPYMDPMGFEIPIYWRWFSPQHCNPIQFRRILSSKVAYGWWISMRWLTLQTWPLGSQYWASLSQLMHRWFFFGRLV